MHPSRMLTNQLHRIRTVFSPASSSRASTTSKSPLSSSSSYVEPTTAGAPPTTSHSQKTEAESEAVSPNLSATSDFSTLSASPSFTSSINHAILVRRRPSSLELELEEERRMFGGRATFVMEPRPTDPLDVSVVPIGGIDEIMGGR